MELKLDELEPKQVYKLLTGLIIPRPIALVTSVDSKGRVNAAPFSYFNVFGSSPPLICLAPGNKDPKTPKDTAQNIIATGEFVVNMVDEAIASAMNECAAPLPAGESELERAKLTAVPSVTVKAPRILESPVSFECKKHQVLEIGKNRLVIATLHVVHIRDGIVDPKTYYVDAKAYHTIGRLHGNLYTKTREVFEMKRPEK